MITEHDFRGGGYNYTIDYYTSYQTEKVSMSRGRCIKITADSNWSDCKLLLPYAPTLKTGGPILTIYQANHQITFDVRNFLDTETIVTIPDRGSWDFLACVFYLVHNVGTSGTWRYYFRRGYSFS